MPRANVVQFRAQPVNREPTERLSDHSIVGPDGTRFTLGQVANSQNWYAFWPGPKRRQRQSLRCRDFEQAKLVLHQWVMEHFRPKQATPETVMIAQALDPYQKLAQARYEGADKYEAGSAKQHLYTVNRAATLMLEWWGDAFIAVLEDRSEQAKFIRHLADARGLNYAVSTISKTMGVLNAALHNARDELAMVKYFPKIITSEQKIAQITRKTVEAPAFRRLTVPELAAFLDAISSRHFFRYMILAMGTLARPDAVCDIQRSSILWDDGAIRLNPVGRKQTKKRRPTIPLLPTLAGWLKVWDGVDLAAGRTIAHYVHQKGHRVDNPKKAFRTTAERAGLVTAADIDPDSKEIRPERAITPYTIRRTMASLLRQHGIVLDDIAGLMGHEVNQREITEIYASLTPEQMERVAAGLEAIFTKVGACTKAAPIRADVVAPKSVPTHRRHRVYGQ
jgi:integrase